MKNVIQVVIVTFLIFLCSGCLLKDNLEKEEIFELVKKNQDTLLKDIKNDNYNQTLKIDGIKEVNSKIKDGYIDFYCGGIGIGSGTEYYGFYYSTDNEINGLWFTGESELVPKGKGYFYQENDSDNTYYTEKITDNFYYYEGHF